MLADIYTHFCCLYGGGGLFKWTDAGAEELQCMRLLLKWTPLKPCMAAMYICVKEWAKCLGGL